MDNIKLIVSEVDGVITDHLSPIDELGNIVFKNFYLEDFDSINELKKHCNFVFLSSDNAINYNLFRRKKIPFYWAQLKSKKEILLDIMRRYNVTPEETIFVGSKASDLQCMRYIPLSFHPEDGSIVVSSIGTKLSSKGGQGVITELYFHFFMDKQNL